MIMERGSLDEDILGPRILVCDADDGLFIHRRADVASENADVLSSRYVEAGDVEVPKDDAVCRAAHLEATEDEVAELDATCMDLERARDGRTPAQSGSKDDVVGVAGSSVAWQGCIRVFARSHLYDLAGLSDEVRPLERLAGCRLGTHIGIAPTWGKEDGC